MQSSIQSEAIQTENLKKTRDLLEPGMVWWVVACFVLSGFSALLYQTAWLRQFSIVFGTSELAVASVLAAYMAGLAGGAFIADKYIKQVRRPIRVYALLEAGIAISALLVPFLLAGASWAYQAILGGQAELPDGSGIGKSIFYLMVTFLLLAVPTGFMGATLPLLTRHVIHKDTQVGPRVALLYSSNTLGAVLGAVVAAFVLLPWLGLRGTVWIGVLVNFIVFLVAIRVSKSMRIRPHDQLEKPGKSEVPGFISACLSPLLRGRWSSAMRQQSVWILLIMLLSGVCSFYYEVLWTRLLSHVLGGSIFAFATMLASFLTGIAIGSAIAGPIAKNKVIATNAFIVAQVGIAVCSLAVYIGIDRLIPHGVGLTGQALFAMGVMLPATLFIGATFPLAVRILTPHPNAIGNVTARIYGWNTVGGIVGAILAGFWLIPLLGYTGSIKYVVATNLLLAMFSAILISRKPLFPALGLLSLLALFLVLYEPARPSDVLYASYVEPNSTTNTQKYFREIYYSVGRSATVLMIERNGAFTLRTNGLPEASVISRGAPPEVHVQKWLTAHPVAARPDTESMLVIGLGGGVALEGIPPTVKQVDVIELEPKVIEANKAIALRRQVDPLQDQRINYIINDARSALSLSNKQYDAIVSQPSHPWTAGASHLYTREFVQLASRHLNEGGVFLQWINWQYIDENMLKVLAATLMDSFKYVRLYHQSPTVLHLLGSNMPLDVELQMYETGRPLKDSPKHYSAIAANTVEDVLAGLALDDKGLRAFVGNKLPNTDDRNLLAIGSRVEQSGYEIEDLSELLAPYDPLLDQQSWIFNQPKGRVHFPYLFSRLLYMGFTKRAELFLETITDPVLQQLFQGMIAAKVGDLNKAKEAYRKVLEIDDSNQEARYLLLSSSLSSLANDSASNDLMQIASQLSGAAGAVVEGWRMGAQSNWQGIFDLEPALASAGLTDLWLRETAQLRAQWRTKVDTPGRRYRMALDAIDIIDQAVVAYPVFSLYILRIAAASIIEDPHMVIETAAVISTYLADELSSYHSGDYRYSPFEKILSINQVDSILAILERTEVPRELLPRLRELKKKLGILQSRLAKVIPAEA